MEEVPMSYTDPLESEDVVDQFPRSALMTPENMMLPYDDYQSFISSDFFHQICLEAGAGGDQFMGTSSSSMPLDSELNSLLNVVEVTNNCSRSDDCQQVDHLIQERDEMDMLVIKSKILHHPLFPRMRRAYAECHSKFAGDEERETSFSDNCEPWNDDISTMVERRSSPELDEFMETYCDILEKHNEDLRNTLGGVTSFLNSMEMQLADICGALSTTSLSGKESKEATIPSPEDDQEQPVNAADDHNNDQTSSSITNLKTSLLSKYGCGHLRNLKLEFSKRTKKKKGKLPNEARQVLVNWWCSHHSWPYPTEADKVELTRLTGLLPKQINNWFINQRKRHWKTSAESLEYSWVDNNLSARRDSQFPDDDFDAAQGTNERLMPHMD